MGRTGIADYPKIRPRFSYTTGGRRALDRYCCSSQRAVGLRGNWKETRHIMQVNELLMNRCQKYKSAAKISVDSKYDGMYLHEHV